MKPTIIIEYCPKCGWLLRAAYMAQEILTTFNDEVEGVLLKPSSVSGRYTIFVGNRELHDRKRDGGFPEIKHLKQLIRNEVCPSKPLGHIDKP